MAALDGKVAIVTGAGQGVGRGIALALAGAGASVVVAGRTEDKLVETREEIARRGGEAVTVVCDVGEREQIQACVGHTLERFGTIDLLVNNAQAVPLGPLLKVPDEAFELGWRTGPLAALRFMRACHPHLKERGGAIVNLASGAGLRPDPVGLGLYAAIKEAIRSITRAAACEWGPDRIRVNAIIPLANSPGMEAWTKIYADEAQRFLATVPLGRVGDCELDIGRAVVALVGPDFSYVTGTTLMLDGGQAYLR
jgi:NAD(P)-dependent dehydrogenase (short-subunit alcohol dehydrogenase family)